ncbi:MAG: alpha-amylase family glycosyl hydrolase, partial [Balneolaceae bacterium]
MSSDKKKKIKITSTQWGEENKTDLIFDYLKTDHAGFIKKNSGFERRFRKWMPVFLEHYGELYGLGFDQSTNLLNLADKIATGTKSRPDWLQKKDNEREDSDWYQHPDLIGAMLYVDQFAGSFAGIGKRISYLKELGINYLHLMPFYKTLDGFNDGGYAVSDYRETRHDLGTVEDLKKLIKKLDSNGIELAADVVLNHTSDEHEWAKKALEGDENYQNYFLMFDDEQEVQEYEKYLIDVFPEFAPGSFTYNRKLEKWIWTSFYSFQWDLNYRNPRLFNAMFNEIQYIANLGAGVLRMDAVPFTWKEKGNSSQNLPQAHTLLRAYRALMRITAPSVVLKSEAIVSPKEIIKYLGTGGYEGFECDLGYNATLMNHMWHALACQNTHLLRTTLHNLPNAPETATWINYVRCHDDIGWGISDENAAAVGQKGWETRKFCTDFYSGNLQGSFSEGYVFQRDATNGEARISGTGAALAGLQKAQVEADGKAIDAAIKRLLLLYSITYFYKGIPLIYMGEEIGQLNDFS